MTKLLFYGPLGGKDGKIVGGGESGNLKTIFILRRLMGDIYMFPKPYPGRGILGGILYILKIHILPIKLLFILITNLSIKSVHVSGFYQHLIYQESILVFMAHIFNKHCVYELRAGGVEEAYKNRSFLYRFFFKRTVNTASVVLVQGKKYQQILKKIGCKKILHYPNYVLGKITEREEIRLPGLIRLVYFGRLSRTKNVGVVIDTAKILKESDVHFKLDIIGGGNVGYINELKRKVKNHNLESNINFCGVLFGDELNEVLKKQHFYIFPSNEPREGHSNALTEAMALGIVPIASDNGFNIEVIGDDYLIIPDFSPDKYAEKILDILNQNSWGVLMKQVQARVVHEYNENKAEEILSGAYDELISAPCVRGSLSPRLL